MKTRSASKKLPLALSVAIVAALCVLPLFFRGEPPLREARLGGTPTLTGARPLFIHPLSIGAARISVAFAQTPADQERGLSGTASLAADEGMLFIFGAPQSPAFWMKDMQYPIDIIWIGEDKKVIGYTERAVPESYPETYTAAAPVRYVLEVNAGFAKKHGVKPGTAVSF